MSNFNLLGISGALRRGSLNTKILHEAARLSDARLRVADMRLPLYDGDLEAADGIALQALMLAGQIEAADAVLIASPECSLSFSGVLKNALDWVARIEGNPWQDKPVGVVSVVSDEWDGTQAQQALRQAMVPFSPRLIHAPGLVLLGSDGFFDHEGHLTGDEDVHQLFGLMNELRAEAGLEILPDPFEDQQAEF